MKDTLCSYYTNSDDITVYMVKKLNITPNDVILEPSAGEGVFIDELLKEHPDLKIDAIDIDSEAVSVLYEKYNKFKNINIREADTLFDDLLDKKINTGACYTKIIGNPPYGAWQDLIRRRELKKKFPNQYVKETYSLFLLRCVSLLMEKGKLSFIIPDTFLFLNLHANLRKFLLINTCIEEIILFPSHFFPKVSYGYSNMCIITLRKEGGDLALNNNIRIIKGFRSASEFSLTFKTDNFPSYWSIYNIKQKDILRTSDYRFILSDKRTRTIIAHSNINFNDIAYIVTGLYTGDNLKYIKVLNHDFKGSKQYDLVNPKLIFDCKSLNGITDIDEGYIPYLKGSSSRRYLRDPMNWFVRWDSNALKEYLKNKKARLQNSQFYFKTGIGIPMVKASTIKAFMIEQNVFDQSIVGVFPKDDSKLFYILGLMNSTSFNKLVHTINPTANNSANYIKNIPYIEPDKKTFDYISNIVKEIISIYRNNSDISNKANDLHNEIDMLFNNIYFG